MSEEKYLILWFFFVLLVAQIANSSPTLHSLTGDYELHQISETEYRMHIMENALENGDKGLGGSVDQDFMKKRNAAFQDIHDKIQTYFIEEAMADFFNEVKKVVANILPPFEFTKQETIAFGNDSCRNCELHELEVLLETYLTLLEKHYELHSNANLENHLITHYDKAKEYMKKKLAKFKSDLSKIRNQSYFNTRKEYYVKKGKVREMMDILYEWCDSLIKSGKDDYVKELLFTHLNRAKRFWLLKELRP